MEIVPTFQSAVVDAKFKRANDLLRELDAKVAAFNSLGAVTAEPAQIDPFAYEYRLKIGQHPPLEEWSLMLGDALHNMRSSLDTLAWELANLVRAPLHPKRVYFPTATSEEDWEKRWVPALESVPEVYLARLKLTQGFLPGDSNVNDALHKLHSLDIDDKHKGLLRADAGLEEFNYKTQLKLGDGVTPVDGTLTPIENPNRSDFVEGNSMFGHRGSVEVSVIAPLSIRVPVIPVLHLDGKKYRALQIASQISGMVAFAIDRVCLGEDDAIDKAIASGFFEVVDVEGRVTFKA